MEACTVICFVSINAKLGIFTVMRLNGTLVEARIRILKVLSSEMDPAESRLIPQNFIKGNVAAGF
jgi:hypothetical protein